MTEEEKEKRKTQLIFEIGIPLLEQASAVLTAEEHAKRCRVDGQWYEILEQFDNGNLMVLLHLLKLPEEVRPYFEDMFRRKTHINLMDLLPRLDIPDKVRPYFEDAFQRKMHQGRRRPPIPLYLPMAENEAIARLAARLVSYLVEHDADEDKAIELATLIYDEVTDTKLRAVLAGKASAARNLRARRAAR